MIIKAAKRIFNSGEICRSYSDFNFGVTFLEHSVFSPVRASAVTPSEESSINTNRKSTTCFPMSPRWTSYVVRKPPNWVAQKRKVSKIWTI